MSIQAFQISGTTKLVAASSSTGLAATQVCTAQEQGVYLANPSTVAIYVALGSSSIAAAQPTTGTPIAGLCIPAGTARTITSPGANAWLSAVTSAGSASPGLFATPGFGQ